MLEADEDNEKKERIVLTPPRKEQQSQRSSSSTKIVMDPETEKKVSNNPSIADEDEISVLSPTSSATSLMATRSAPGEFGRPRVPSLISIDKNLDRSIGSNSFEDNALPPAVLPPQVDDSNNAMSLLFRQHHMQSQEGAPTIDQSNEAVLRVNNGQEMVQILSDSTESKQFTDLLENIAGKTVEQRQTMVLNAAGEVVGSEQRTTVVNNDLVQKMWNQKAREPPTGSHQHMNKNISSPPLAASKPKNNPAVTAPPLNNSNSIPLPDGELLSNKNVNLNNNLFVNDQLQTNHVVNNNSIVPVVNNNNSFINDNNMLNNVNNLNVNINGGNNSNIINNLGNNNGTNNMMSMNGLNNINMPLLNNNNNNYNPMMLDNGSNAMNNNLGVLPSAIINDGSLLLNNNVNNNLLNNNFMANNNVAVQPNTMMNLNNNSGMFPNTSNSITVNNMVPAYNNINAGLQQGNNITSNDLTTNNNGVVSGIVPGGTMTDMISINNNMSNNPPNNNALVLMPPVQPMATFMPVMTTSDSISTTTNLVPAVVPMVQQQQLVDHTPTMSLPVQLERQIGPTAMQMNNHCGQFNSGSGTFNNVNASQSLQNAFANVQRVNGQFMDMNGNPVWMGNLPNNSMSMDWTQNATSMNSGGLGAILQPGQQGVNISNSQFPDQAVGNNFVFSHGNPTQSQETAFTRFQDAYNVMFDQHVKQGTMTPAQFHARLGHAMQNAPGFANSTGGGPVFIPYANNNTVIPTNNINNSAIIPNSLTALATNTNNVGALGNNMLGTLVQQANNNIQAFSGDIMLNNDNMIANRIKVIDETTTTNNEEEGSSGNNHVRSWADVAGGREGIVNDNVGTTAANIIPLHNIIDDSQGVAVTNNVVFIPTDGQQVANVPTVARGSSSLSVGNTSPVFLSTSNHAAIVPPHRSSWEEISNQDQQIPSMADMNLNMPPPSHLENKTKVYAHTIPAPPGASSTFPSSSSTTMMNIPASSSSTMMNIPAAPDMVPPPPPSNDGSTPVGKGTSTMWNPNSVPFNPGSRSFEDTAEYSFYDEFDTSYTTWGGADQHGGKKGKGKKFNKNNGSYNVADQPAAMMRNPQPDANPYHYRSSSFQHPNSRVRRQILQKGRGKNNGKSNNIATMARQTNTTSNENINDVENNVNHLPSAVAVTSPYTNVILHEGEIGWHESDSLGMGRLYNDNRTFMKNMMYDDLLSTVSEAKVRRGGVHTYCVRFRNGAGTLSAADGMGFVFQDSLPIVKNIQKINSIFLNKKGYICMRNKTSIKRGSVVPRLTDLQHGDLVWMKIDLDNFTAEFTIEGEDGLMSHGGLMFKDHFSEDVDLSAGAMVCVVKRAGVQIDMLKYESNMEENSIEKLEQAMVNSVQ